MNKHILLKLGLCFVANSIIAQAKLTFAYDRAGNQIKYSYCSNGDCSNEVRSLDKSRILTKVAARSGAHEQLHSRFTIFPNPVQHTIHLKLNQKTPVNIREVFLFDSLGRKIKVPFQKKDEGANISILNYPKGAYFIRYIFDDRAPITQKIIKN